MKIAPNPPRSQALPGNAYREAPPRMVSLEAEPRNEAMAMAMAILLVPTLRVGTRSGAALPRLHLHNPCVLLRLVGPVNSKPDPGPLLDLLQCPVYIPLSKQRSNVLP